MELQSAILQIRERLERSYPLLLKQCGMTESADRGVATAGFQDLRDQILPILQADETQLGRKEAWKKFVQEAAFTTLNRLIGLKAMEARGMLDRATIAKRAETGGKSEAHYLYLSGHSEDRDRPGQGINAVLTNAFGLLAQELPQLYNHSRYGFLPRPEDTAAVIDLINAVGDEEWLKDDIIGWVYQYYNAEERKRLKDSKAKIDKTNVHYQSQQYTPRWVVKHIVDNTLGRYYLEMYPDSPLYEEIEVPLTKKQLIKEREPKMMEEIKVLDPACGSGNFLLYAFELLYKMYRERGYAPTQIPSLILKRNLYGIDLDDRAAQLTILSLYLKARTFDKEKNKYTMNIVSADFHLSDLIDLTAIKQKYRSESAIQDFIELIWEQLKDPKALGSLLDITGELETLKQRRKKADIMFYREEEWQEMEMKALEDIKSGVSPNEVIGGYIEQGMNFAELLIQKYDIVVANPPYLDSSDMTESLKKTLKTRFEGFSKNLFAAFIKRCADFAVEEGYVGMITPQTYMFLSSYEDVRGFLLSKTSLRTFVQVGLGGVFERGVDVDISIFCIKKTVDIRPAIFIKLDQFSRTPQEPFKKAHMKETIEALRRGKPNQLAYTLHPSEFKKIPGDPFVYWISDRIRGLFTRFKPVEEYVTVVAGVQTSDNDRFLRFWWEVPERDISIDYSADRRKWVPYAKGGPFNKWYGNLWWVIDWQDGGDKLRNFLLSVNQDLHAVSYHFKEGLTYTTTTSLGSTYRKLPFNHIFDTKGSAVFPIGNYIDAFLSFFTSELFSYISQSIRPNVDFSVGDLKTISMPVPSSFETKTIDRNRLSNPLGTFASGSPLARSDAPAGPITLSGIAEDCIAIKKALYAFHIVERDYCHDPLSWALGKLTEEGKPLNVSDALKTFFRYKAELEARLLLNEALNDELVFKLYGLLPDEMALTGALAQLGLLDNPETGPSREAENGDLSAVLEVLTSEGVPVGAYPPRALTGEERKTLERLYLNHRHDRGSDRSEAISGMDFGIVEELSAAFKVSPITVAQEIALIEELPPEAAQDALSEHIQALAIDILRKDPDGILSLGADTGESSLRDRIIERWRAMGIGQSYHELENLLGKRLEAYLLKDFFKDHSKRFQNRPILWHLVSDEGNVNFFVLHHAWSYDRLLLLKSKYLGDVKRALDNTLATETDEMKREKLIQRMAELERFADTLGALLDGSYQPKTDDGVAKNIAPLQHKGLLKYNPLSGKMVDKMLKVKW